LRHRSSWCSGVFLTGREKKIVLIGCLLAALTYFPIFRELPISRTRHESACSARGEGSSPIPRLQLSVRSVGKKKFVQIVRHRKSKALAKAGVRTAPT